MRRETHMSRTEQNYAPTSGRGSRKKQAGTQIPTLFGNELLNPNTGLINSRPHHPQTN